MSEAVKKIFDEISPTYDRLNHYLSFNIDKSWRKKSIALVSHKPDDSFNVLDVCAGTHDFGIPLVQKFKKAKVTALDFSLEMLKIGDAKLKNLRLETAVNSQVGDALNLPFSDSTFDVVLCAYGVRNFDDTQKGLSEMFRVLKPGGQVLILEFFKPTRFFTKLFHKSYAQYILPFLGHLIAKHASAYRYLRDSIQGFITLPECQNLLKNLGFKKISHQNFLFSISSVIVAYKPLSEDDL